MGRHLTNQLNESGIKTVLELVHLDPAMIRARCSVILECTVRELQGTSCIAFDDVPSPKQEIATTRSFGHPWTQSPVRPWDCADGQRRSWTETSVRGQ